MKSNFPSNAMIPFIRQVKEVFLHPREQADNSLGSMLKGLVLVSLGWTLICRAFVSAGEVLCAHSLPGRAKHASDVLNFKPQRLGSNHVQRATESSQDLTITLVKDTISSFTNQDAEIRF